MYYYIILRWWVILLIRQREIHSFDWLKYVSIDKYNMKAIGWSKHFELTPSLQIIVWLLLICRANTTFGAFRKVKTIFDFFILTCDKTELKPVGWLRFLKNIVKFYNNKFISLPKNVDNYPSKCGTMPHIPIKHQPARYEFRVCPSLLFEPTW